MDQHERDEIVRTFAAFMQECVNDAQFEASGSGPQLTAVLAAHLGADPRTLPVVTFEVANHQFVNLDVALDLVAGREGGARVIGVGGGDQRHHLSFGDLVQHSRWQQFPVATPERVNLPAGPDLRRQALAYGVRLFRFEGAPVAVLQRQSKPQFGRGSAAIEVLAGEGVADPLIAQIRHAMVEHSVFRGQVLTLGGADEAFVPGVGGISFHHRPQLTADDLVLPPGALPRIERHVVGAARHRDLLRAAGQHLKRGLLVYGPPGTGKTHTVRYLLSTLTGVTTVVLSGTSLRFVGEAAELAVALQPALVVLEDVDLVAEHRDLHHDPQPLLFTLLEAMDGLASDADVAFLLTTNRADLLEPALAQRPGRVDLAVEIPLPDLPAREALMRLYARALPLSAEALLEAARCTGGTTASFARELMRRTTLIAAELGRPITDDDLRAALGELLDDGETLTRSLLGSVPPAG